MYRNSIIIFAFVSLLLIQSIDAQTRDFNNYLMTSNPVEAHYNNVAALEHYSNKKLNGLMNCTAQNLPCIFNTKYSATTRVGVDYKLNQYLKKTVCYI